MAVNGMGRGTTLALDILELLARSDRPMAHGEVARVLGAPKSSLTDLFATLLERGFLEFEPVSRRYSPGPALVPLARSYLNGSDIVSSTVPALEELVRCTGETALTAIRSGDQLLVVAARQGSNPLSLTLRVGDCAPLHGTASGKVFLACMTAEERDALLKRAPLTPVTDYTICDRAVLERELVGIARGEVAYSRQEYIPDLIVLARPILNPNGRAVAALSVAIPAFRHTEARDQDAREILINAANTVTRSLCGSVKIPQPT